jgi:hypothetical protein
MLSRKYFLVILSIVTALLASLLAVYSLGARSPSRPTPTSATASSVAATPVPTRVNGLRPTVPLPSATTAPQPTAVAPTPLDAQAPTPTFAFEPRQGRPGTVVEVRGWNFAPNAPLHVGIGFPTRAGPALANVLPDSSGAWQVQIILPELQLSPSPDWSRAHLLIEDAEARTLASAPFSFSHSTELTHEAASQTVEDLLDAYTQGEDVQPYLASQLHAQLDAGQPLDVLLNLSGAALLSYRVGAPEERPSEVLFVPVTLVHSAVEERRVFTLVVEDGRWRVNGSGPAHPPPSEAPSREAASQTVRDFLDAYTSGADVQPYLASQLRAQLDMGHSLDQLLNLSPTGFTSFNVSVPENLPSEVLFVPVTLISSTAHDQRVFTLGVEYGQWRINGSGPAHTPPSGPGSGLAPES